MDCVILDGYTLNPGDLSWAPLERLGCLTIYDRTPPELTAARIGGAEAAMTNKTPIGRAVFEACPGLHYVGVLATGYNVVDLEAARDHGVTVTNIPAYSTEAVAQHVFALLLELTNRVGAHSESVRAGGWQRAEDFCYWEHPMVELAGKTLGIIGYGRIGQAVAIRAAAFGMEVLVCSSHTIREEAQIHAASLAEVYRRADILSLHCPLTEERRGMIDRRAIAEMKDGVLLINTARGPLIREEDLYEALCSGKVGGAALDVLSQEPPRNGNLLIGAPNCIITPHLAWGPRETRARLLEIAARNWAAFQAGTPVNAVTA